MSRRRTSRAPLWAKILAAILAVALLVLVLVLLGRLIFSVVRTVSGSGVTTADPQFREEAVTVTRPPEPDEGAGLGREDADPSSSWVVEEEGPVDQTPEELALEPDNEGADPAEDAPQ